MDDNSDSVKGQGSRSKAKRWGKQATDSKKIRALHLIGAQQSGRFRWKGALIQTCPKFSEKARNLPWVSAIRGKGSSWKYVSLTSANRTFLYLSLTLLFGWINNRWKRTQRSDDGWNVLRNVGTKVDGSYSTNPIPNCLAISLFRWDIGKLINIIASAAETSLKLPQNIAKFFGSIFAANPDNWFIWHWNHR